MSKLRRYLVFMFNTPVGECGWEAFVGSYDTVPEAKDTIFERKKHYPEQIWQIVDSELGVEIARGGW